nr:DMT family transporter [Herbaspirillum sp. B65]
MTTTSSTSLRSGQAVPATRSTIGLFIFVVLAWSLNWVVMKLAVHDIAPLWAITMRTALAAILLFPILYLNRQLILPPRSDYPVVVSISLFHMVGFAALMTLGLTHISAGRAIVLGYTTPLWVAPAAVVFLKEKMSIREMLGMVIGIGGLLLLVGSNASDWRAGRHLGECPSASGFTQLVGKYHLHACSSLDRDTSSTDAMAMLAGDRGAQWACSRVGGIATYSRKLSYRIGAGVQRCYRHRTWVLGDDGREQTGSRYYFSSRSPRYPYSRHWNCSGRFRGAD